MTERTIHNRLSKLIKGIVNAIPIEKLEPDLYLFRISQFLHEDRVLLNTLNVEGLSLCTDTIYKVIIFDDSFILFALDGRGICQKGYLSIYYAQKRRTIVYP